MIITDTNIKKTFAKNLKGIRRAKKMTQEQFSAQLGLSRPTYGAYEECRATPPLASLIVISNILGFDIPTLATHDIFKTTRKNGK